MDVERKRISLTMKLGAPPQARASQGAGPNRFESAGRQPPRRTGNSNEPAPQSSMAAAFSKLKR